MRIVRTCLKSGKALRENQRALRNGERGEFSIISLRRVWNSGSLEGSGKRKKKKKKRTAWRGRGATKQTRKTSGEKGAGCYFMVETRARIHSHASWFASWFTRERNGKHCFTLTPKLVRPVSRYQRIGSQCDTRPPSNSNCRISRPAIPPLISHFIIVRKKHGG